MKFTNRGYDGLKFVALVLLPGLSAAYFSLAQIWDLPNAEQVVGTATILDTLLGLLLKSSSNTHKQAEKVAENVTDGALVVTKDPEDGEKYLTLHVSREVIDTIEDRQTIKLTVAPQAVSSNEHE